ncbi:MAG: bifunctional hydroxymethylpyrimidine kinase/phosphomethylpyrimidine kinase [Verrucomicrobiota bacterium]|nr:bifunctional hydroxymethylpyrimidine kinase/phosphomethylpyrimidine kinase [Verrucomicrobiota bacterium]
MSDRRSRKPIALTIAGSDSGGGAGIQADLKTFAALAVHGTSVITCLTAQNPKEVLAVEAASGSIIQGQLKALFAELPPLAVKTGMLYSVEIIEVIAKFFWEQKRRQIPLIIDPVMVATSGAKLLQPAAIQAFRDTLLPRAALVTPNLDETEMLLGRSIVDVEGMRIAARELHDLFGCAALIKGGHLKGIRQAIDIFYDGREELLLDSVRIKGVSTHGTGCTYSAAITGYIALGCKIPYAVQLGKEFITQAIAQSYFAGKHSVLEPFWE